MQTVKKEYEVYEFSELSKEAQKKVLDEFREINAEHWIWWHAVEDQLKDDLEKLGYNYGEMFFSGFSSQGDGACFTATVDIPRWLKAHKLGNKYRALAKAYMDGVAEIKITHNYRYYFATSTNVEPNDYAAPEKAQAQMAEVVELILKERETIGNKLYRDLEAEYDFITSDDAVEDTIRSNEYQFLKDGTQFTE